MAARGACPVHLSLAPPSAPQLRVRLRTDQQWRVAPSRRLMQRLVSLLDERNVLFRGRPAESTRGNGRRRWRQRNGQDAAGGQTSVASEAVTRFN